MDQPLNAEISTGSIADPEEGAANCAEKLHGDGRTPVRV